MTIDNLRFAIADLRIKSFYHVTLAERRVYDNDAIWFVHIEFHQLTSGG